MFGRLDLDSLWMALQPIVDLEDGRVLGHEALVRGDPGSPWPHPRELAAQAGREGRERELEARCRMLALEVGRDRLPPDQRLFLNVDLRHMTLPLDTSPSRVSPGRVVVEICEGQSLLDDPDALAIIHRWRRQGYLIALDDYGTGYAALGALLAIQPHVLKVDRSIVQGVERDSRHRRALAGLVELTRDLEIELVAEGVETPAQFRALRALGVRRGQGFLIGRPERQPGANCPAELLSATTPSARATARVLPAEAGRGLERTVAEAVGQGMYSVDRRRTILRWNSTAESLTGYAAAEMVGRQCMHSGLGHLNADGVPLCHGACPLVHTIADGRPRSDLVWIRHRQGHLVPAHIHTSPIVDEAERVVGAVEVFTVADDRVAGPPPSRRPDPLDLGQSAAGSE